MSAIYANGLSNYRNKGKCGLPEIFDDPEELDRKVNALADHIRQSKMVVVHTGAGISTSAGIPDFRGPKGVWTLEKKGKKPQVDKSFDEARPTLTHMALVALLEKGIVSFIVSQNIDGLHLRSGVPRRSLVELHGNILVSRCDYCNGLFVRPTMSETVGQKPTGEVCPSTKTNGRQCRGKLIDTILDWNHGLPKEELDLAEAFSQAADLSISMGTTLQIVPSGALPAKSKKLVICNLQPTKYDSEADLVIHAPVDDVMRRLCERLGVTVPEYDPDTDPFLQLKKKKRPPPLSVIPTMTAADLTDGNDNNQAAGDDDPHSHSHPHDHEATVLKWTACVERLVEFPTSNEDAEPEAKKRRVENGEGTNGNSSNKRGRKKGSKKRRGNGWTVVKHKTEVHSNSKLTSVTKEETKPRDDEAAPKDEEAPVLVKQEIKQEEEEEEEEEAKQDEEENVVEGGRGDDDEGRVVKMEEKITDEAATC